MKAKGIADDGSDDSLASPSIANKGVMNGIGKITVIEPVTFHVALKKGEDPEPFTFSKKWNVPRTILGLSSGILALQHISFFVADDELVANEIIIGRTVLSHLGIDTVSLLVQNRKRLDEIDCSSVGNSTRNHGCGMVSSLIFSRTNIMASKSDQTSVNYFESRED